MQHWISIVALILSVASFVLFAITIIIALKKELAKPIGAVQESALPNLGDVAKVIDSLSKAGPSVLTLFAAIAFIWFSMDAATPPKEAGSGGAGKSTPSQSAPATPK